MQLESNFPLIVQLVSVDLVTQLDIIDIDGLEICQIVLQQIAQVTKMCQSRLQNSVCFKTTCKPIDLFKPVFLIFGLLVIKLFWMFERFFCVFLPTYLSFPRFYLYTHSRYICFLECTYFLIKENTLGCSHIYSAKMS